MIKEKKRHVTDCLVICAGLIIVGILKDIDLLFYVAACLALTCAIIPFIAKIVSYVWQGLGKVLGFFVSKIILGTVFYFFLFPISLLQKLFTKNRSISNKKKSSYWITKEETNMNFNKLW